MKDGYQKFFYIASIQKFPFLPVGCKYNLNYRGAFYCKKEKSVGKEIVSQSLLANANESFLDILIPIVVLAGILLAYAKIPYIEGSIIILISLLILKLGLENVWKSLLVLMYANLDPQLQFEIEEKMN